MKSVLPVCILSCLSLLPGCKTSPSGSLANQSAEPSPAAPAEPLDENLLYIKDDAARMVTKKHNELGAPANRDFHSRGMCLKGKFTVTPAASSLSANVDFFAQAATYPMYGRFSNGFPGRDSSDRTPSVFGFGIKVIGVPGQKFDMQSLGSTKPVNSNQDWNLATGETFAIPTAQIYREQREASAGGAAKFAQFAARHPRVARDLLASLTNIDSFLSAGYHSQVALHFGEDHIAKFSVTPCTGGERTILAARALTRHKDYLREDLTTKIKRSGGCFLFRAQVRPADDKLPAEHADWAQRYPADNPTIQWSSRDIPFVTLAKIEFPPQPNVENLQASCEGLSFNPGNTLQALRPIESDSLMRSRFLSAYEGSVKTRTALNSSTQSEPAPVSDIASWINE